MLEEIYNNVLIVSIVRYFIFFTVHGFLYCITFWFEPASLHPVSRSYSIHCESIRHDKPQNRNGLNTGILKPSNNTVLYFGTEGLVYNRLLFSAICTRCSVIIHFFGHHKRSCLNKCMWKKPKPWNHHNNLI